MDGPGRKFLAGSAFAIDDNRCVAHGRLFNDIDDILHDSRLADHALEVTILIQLARKLYDFLIQPVKLRFYKNKWNDNPEKGIIDVDYIS